MSLERNLCMGCMELKKNGHCPNPQSCGWVEGAPNYSQFQLQPRTKLVDKYLIGKVLGQGGFGITYLSWDLEENRKLAIKEYFPVSFATRNTDHRTVAHSNAENLDPYLYGLRKFAQEARTLERLRGHANIVSVIAFLEANNTGYIVMEYLEGITLARYLTKQENGKISFDQSLQILLPVMDALREVHSAHFAHRDVSPDNIVLCRAGPVKLIDFGAAREALRDPRTQQLVLKPGYTPWEQYLADGIAGPWTDIYALGATLYRCVTGVIPPESPVRISDDKLISPGKLGVTLPAQSEKALLRALAVRSNERYQTIAEFQQELAAPDPAGSGVKKPPQNETRSGFLNTFRLRWSIGTVLTFAGSFFALPLKAPLLLLGIVALGMSVRPAIQLPRQAGLNKRVLVLMLAALLGALLSAFSPWGVVVLVAGGSIGWKLTGVARSAPAADFQEPQTPSQIGLRFSAGDQIGETLDVGSDAITIGRDPRAANLVISSPLVSGAHAKVCFDPSRKGLRIEDLNSRNGTYICRTNEDSRWSRLGNPEVLSKGDKFYLSEESVALFEVV